MPNIQLPTGKTIYVSTYDFLFVLKDDEVHLFYQSCVADDLGNFVEDPFSNTGLKGSLEVDEEPTIEEIPQVEEGKD